MKKIKTIMQDCIENNSILIHAELHWRIAQYKKLPGMGSKHKLRKGVKNKCQ